MGVRIAETFSWWESRGELPPSDLLDARSARRATFLARGAALAIDRVGGFGDNTAVVFGSCLGNITVTMELLEQIRAGDAGLSPIRFMNSVHHAAVSHVSIAADQRGFVTAVAGQRDLCAVGLMESIALCKERLDDVILVLCEERWPEAFHATAFEPYAGGVRLTWDERSDTELLLERTSAEFDESALPDELQGNPAASLEHVIAFANHDEPAERLIAPAHRGAWKLTRTWKTNSHP